MPYATVPDFIAAHPRLDSVTSATACAYLQRASATIDAFVGRAYTLPITPAPPLLSGLCTDLAYSALMRRNAAEADKDSTIKTIYEDAISRLEELRDGKTTLVYASGAPVDAAASDAPWSNTMGYIPTVGVSDLTDSEVDPDRLDDEDDARS